MTQLQPNTQPSEYMIRLVNGQTASYKGRAPADLNSKYQRGTLAECKSLVRQEHAKTEGLRISGLLGFNADGSTTDMPLPDGWPVATPNVPGEQVAVSQPTEPPVQSGSDPAIPDLDDLAAGVPGWPPPTLHETVQQSALSLDAAIKQEAVDDDRTEAASGTVLEESVENDSDFIPEPVSTDLVATSQTSVPMTDIGAAESARFTIIRYTTPIGKKFSRGSDGTLIKETMADGYEGVATIVTCSTIEEMEQAFKDATASDIFVAGLPDQESVAVTSKSKRGMGEVARTKKDFPHRDGPGVWFIDNDHPIGIDNDQFSAYVQAVPALAGASYVVAPSSSAWIHDMATEMPLKGAGGQHYAVTVKDASDIPRVTQTLHHRMVLAGHGKPIITKSGIVLIRSPVDIAMKTSNQPLFQRVTLGSGLEQRKADHIGSHRGEVFLFDTHLIADLSIEEQEQLEEIESTLLGSVADEAITIREIWIAERVQKVAASNNIDRQTAAERLRTTLTQGAASARYDLFPGLQIKFEGELVDVIELLADPLKHDGKPCADPLEPDYGNGVGVAKFFANKGVKPTINSHAHGGQLYFLHPDLGGIVGKLNQPHQNPIGQPAGSDRPIAVAYANAMTKAALMTPDTPPANVEALVEETLSLSIVERRRVLERLKVTTGLTLGTLQDVVSESRDGEDEIDHLYLARQVIDDTGRENVITSVEGVHIWGGGLWQRQRDRAVKFMVQQFVAQQPIKIYKTVIDGVTDVFKTETYLPDHQFNVGPPETVNCINGEVALVGSKWTLFPPKREHYRTTQIPVAFNSTATAPLFAHFLEEVFAGDKDCAEKCRTILEMIGYTLMSHCRHERFIILIGRGANGKSVLLSVLEGLVGPSNVAGVQPSQFDRSFMRAHLLSKLANIVTEIKQGEVIDDASLKGIVSGEPTTVENKFKDPFNMRPFATCWFGTNHMPHTRDFSDALFRRALVVNFNNVFKPELGNSDPNLTAKLMAELPGILNMALDAYAASLVNGFTLPVSCVQARETWRMEADQVAQFVDDECVRQEGSRVAFSALYVKYKRWCEVNSINKGLTSKSFRERLDRLGFGNARTSEAKYVTGMRFALTEGEYGRLKDE